VIDNFKSAVERFDKNLFEKNIAAKNQSDILSLSLSAREP
jgi:hypothetical protein